MPSTVTFKCVDNVPKGMPEPSRSFGTSQSSFYADYGEEVAPPDDSGKSSHTADDIGSAEYDSPGEETIVDDDMPSAEELGLVDD